MIGSDNQRQSRDAAHSGGTRQGSGVIRREYSRRGILHRARLLTILAFAVLVLAVLTGHLGHLVVVLVLVVIAVVGIAVVLLVRWAHRLWVQTRARWGR